MFLQNRFCLIQTYFAWNFLTLQTAARGIKYTPSIIGHNFLTVVKQGMSVWLGKDQKMTSTCNMQLSSCKKDKDVKMF